MRPWAALAFLLAALPAFGAEGVTVVPNASDGEGPMVGRLEVQLWRKGPIPKPSIRVVEGYGDDSLKVVGENTWRFAQRRLRVTFEALPNSIVFVNGKILTNVGDDQFRTSVQNYSHSIDLSRADNCASVIVLRADFRSESYDLCVKVDATTNDYFLQKYGRPAVEFKSSPSLTLGHTWTRFHKSNALLGPQSARTLALDGRWPYRYGDWVAEPSLKLGLLGLSSIKTLPLRARARIGYDFDFGMKVKPIVGFEYFKNRVTKAPYFVRFVGDYVAPSVGAQLEVGREKLRGGMLADWSFLKTGAKWSAEAFAEYSVSPTYSLRLQLSIDRLSGVPLGSIRLSEQWLEATAGFSARF